MKRGKMIIGWLATIVTCCTFVGCAVPSRSVESVGGNYETVLYTYRSLSEPEGHRTALQYRNSEGKRTIIWPSLRSGVITKEDIAVFIGFDGRYPQLMCVRAAGPPIDITRQVLNLGAQQRNQSFSKLSQSANVSTFKKIEGGIEITFSVDWEDPRVKLSWDQLSDLMGEAMETGRERKSVGGTTYLEKEMR